MLEKNWRVSRALDSSYDASHSSQSRERTNTHRKRRQKKAFTVKGIDPGSKLQAWTIAYNEKE